MKTICLVLALMFVLPLILSGCDGGTSLPYVGPIDGGDAPDNGGTPTPPDGGGTPQPPAPPVNGDDNGLQPPAPPIL